MKAKINSIVQKEIEAINNIPIDGIGESVIVVLYKRIHQKRESIVNGIEESWSNRHEYGNYPILYRHTIFVFTSK